MLRKYYLFYDAIILICMVSVSACSGLNITQPAKPVQLRLGVALTPQELASFQPALEAIDQAHPEFEIALETTPQSSVQEKITSQLAAGELPDVIRIQGLLVQQWIRKNAFLDLSEREQGQPNELGRLLSRSAGAIPMAGEDLGAAGYSRPGSRLL